MKNIFWISGLILSLSLLSGCSSSSSNTQTYDSGSAEITEEILVDETGVVIENTSIVVLDKQTNEEVGSTTIPSGTVVRDNNGNPVTEAVNINIKIESVKTKTLPHGLVVEEEDEVVVTDINITASTNSSTIVEEIDQPIEVVIKSPALSDSENYDVEEVVFETDDPTVETQGLSASIQRGWGRRSYRFSYRYYRPYRYYYRIFWRFKPKPQTTGAAGGN